jgi:hypothetical protein
MTPEDHRLLIPEYLSGRMTAVEASFFETAMAADADLRSEVEELRSLWQDLSLLAEQQPSPVLRAQFYQKLNALNLGKPRPSEKRSWWAVSWPKQLAFGALVFALGLLVGRTLLDQRVHKDEIAQMRSQVQGLQEMVALSLLERQSPTSRLEGVAWSNKIDRPNDQLLSALVAALNHDPNVNVRLSSLDALEKFTSDGAISKALIDSIQRQDSPLVQVALIDSLVRIRDHSAADEFKKLAVDSQINPEVRQRAQWGLQKLVYQ